MLRKNLKEKAKRLITEIPAIYLALRDKRTPLSAKIFASITVAYALSPIDLIPDFIPLLGYLDDLVILPMLIMLTLHFMPKNIISEKREKAKEQWHNVKQKNGTKQCR